MERGESLNRTYFASSLKLNERLKWPQLNSKLDQFISTGTSLEPGQSGRYDRALAWVFRWTLTGPVRGFSRRKSLPACSLRLAAAAIRLRLRLLQYFSLYGLQLQQSKQLQQCRLAASRTRPVCVTEREGQVGACFTGGEKERWGRGVMWSGGSLKRWSVLVALHGGCLYREDTIRYLDMKLIKLFPFHLLLLPGKCPYVATETYNIMIIYIQMCVIRKRIYKS